MIVCETCHRIFDPTRTTCVECGTPAPPPPRTRPPKSPHLAVGLADVTEGTPILVDDTDRAFAYSDGVVSAVFGRGRHVVGFDAFVLLLRVAELRVPLPSIPELPPIAEDAEAGDATGDATDEATTIGDAGEAGDATATGDAAEAGDANDGTETPAHCAAAADAKDAAEAADTGGSGYALAITVEAPGALLGATRDPRRLVDGALERSIVERVTAAIAGGSGPIATRIAGVVAELAESGVRVELVAQAGG